VYAHVNVCVCVCACVCVRVCVCVFIAVVLMLPLTQNPSLSPAMRLQPAMGNADYCCYSIRQSACVCVCVCVCVREGERERERKREREKTGIIPVQVLSAFHPLFGPGAFSPMMHLSAAVSHRRRTRCIAWGGASTPRPLGVSSFLILADKYFVQVFSPLCCFFLESDRWK